MLRIEQDVAIMMVFGFMRFLMEDFSIGSILSGIVATVICSAFAYIFLKNSYAKKQKLKLDDSEVHGNIDQIIKSDENHDESEQSIELKKTIVEGGISQTCAHTLDLKHLSLIHI